MATCDTYSVRSSLPAIWVSFSDGQFCMVTRYDVIRSGGQAIFEWKYILFSLYGWVCFSHTIGQFAVRNLLYGPNFLKKMLISELWISWPRKKGLNKVIRRLSTLRTWMLTLAFNILNCVYLWTKAMKKLTRNLIEEDSSQCLKILS